MLHIELIQTDLDHVDSFSFPLHAPKVCASRPGLPLREVRPGPAFPMSKTALNRESDMKLSRNPLKSARRFGWKPNTTCSAFNFYHQISGVSIDEDQTCFKRSCRCIRAECLRQQDRGSCSHDRSDSSACRHAGCSGG